MRYVKFSPEEMAYDAPADVSHLPFKPAKASRGVEKLRQALNAEHGYVKLEPDLAAFFKDDRIVNETLRRAMEIMKLKPGAKRRKTA